MEDSESRLSPWPLGRLIYGESVCLCLEKDDEGGVWCLRDCFVCPTVKVRSDLLRALEEKNKLSRLLVLAFMAQRAWVSLCTIRASKYAMNRPRPSQVYFGLMWARYLWRCTFSRRVNPFPHTVKV